MSYWYVGMSIVAAATAVYSTDSARKAQNNATDVAKAAAKKNQQQSEEATNRANAKTPDVSAMMSANAQAAKGGQSGTMLTGPAGVDPTQLTLGKTSLLGGGG